jgi:hypothetical protein
MRKQQKFRGAMAFECDDGFSKIANRHDIDPEFEFLADELEDAVREMSLEEKAEEEISDFSDDS